MARKTVNTKRHAPKFSASKQENQEKDKPAFPSFVPSSKRKEQGKAIRDIVTRQSHAQWAPGEDRGDPIDILEESNKGRIEHLIPIRYGRMLKSPFTFFRGSAALMASDLAKTPVSGLKVQLCGDCHLLNFGGYATPERNLIVDINDFDETLPGPFEWDLKRLATSFVLACKDNGFKATVGKEAAQTVARSYRRAMRDFAEKTALDIWYSFMDLDTYLGGIKDKQFMEDALAYLKKVKSKPIKEYYFPKMTVSKGDRIVFKDETPLVYHTDEQRDAAFLETARKAFEDYKDSLNEARRVLLDRYTIMDVAMKVVGIGSVGTYCGVILLMANDNDPLILQVKEARHSVLEPYLSKSKHKLQGQRVVEGQRMMQSHSDIFLGYARGVKGKDFFIRQLKDMKVSPIPEMWTTARAIEVADSFGWILARAHARSGDPAMISGYLGSKDTFDKAVAEFAVAYADQTERDYKALIAAVRSGRLEATIER